MKRTNGFTLIELLVVVAIITLLIGILLPSLGKARENARRASCGVNLRSIGQGIFTYEAEMGMLPFAYIYKGQKIVGGTQSPSAATSGYVNWSALISQGGTLIDQSDTSTAGNIAAVGKIPAKAFLCPSIPNGGLPPTNTDPANLESGQVPETTGVTDIQVPRLGYTVNEALLPRNKWVVGFQGSLRTYHAVKTATVREAPGSLILATEFINNWKVVTAGANSGGSDLVVKSHRPISGFMGVGGESDLDLVMTGGGGFGHAATPNLRRATPGDLSSTEPTSSSANRLDWIGRNHGGGAYATRQTNFAYLDGHVEPRLVADTLKNFQWGSTVYSLSPGDDILP